ncbi:hypothetical protein [Geodermatophilus sp. SYSU D00815]
MRVRIHRGAHEIGGSCVEVESAGARRDPALLGVLASHPHLDHDDLAARMEP